MSPSPFRRLLGRAVRTRRKELSLSQEKLGEVAGLHRTYIGAVERGERNVGIDNLSSLAAALEMRLSRLFEAAENVLPTSE
jgi:transcriptional regulator with XRE-family HTH domain